MEKEIEVEKIPSRQMGADMLVKHDWSRPLQQETPGDAVIFIDIFFDCSAQFCLTIFLVNFSHTYD